MRALSEAILTDIRTAVSPVDVQPYRPETIELPFVWVREPETNIGQLRRFDIFRGALIYIDIFDYAWVGVDQIESQIADVMQLKIVLSYGDARNIVYTKESAIPVYEGDAAHLSLIYSATFVDMRVA